MNTDDRGKDASHEDDTVRERSAEERSITAPTPQDVRATAKAEDGEDEDGENAQPPAADTQAP